MRSRVLIPRSIVVVSLIATATLAFTLQRTLRPV
jgi:hypothetical protein